MTGIVKARTRQEHVRLIAAAHGRVPGNRGGFPKGKAICRRLESGKPVYPEELEWVARFEREHGIGGQS
jgi:hypothetical protein